MSFLSNLGFSSLKEEEKIRSAEASETLILSFFEDFADIADFKNHKSHHFPGRKNVYRFTCKMMSLKLLSNLSKDKRIKNVFFSPSQPPPGGGLDGISMRYKVYIEYY